MRVLIVGGTGLISTGIIKHLLARGAEVTMFNRGQRERRVPAEVRHISGDRAKLGDFAAEFEKGKFDVVMDMICFTPEQAEASIAAFRGRCEHFIFCSTVCTYGTKVPPGVFVDETWPQEPISAYGRGKVACEQLMMQAHERGDFKATIIRPSSTYGPGGNLIDNVESSPVAWDRIEKGLPVLCAGDGLGLWVSTHRDDCGKLFAYAALNPKTYGQAYNATREHHHTWREHYATVAKVLRKPAKLVFMPGEWIANHDPKRFGLLKEITQFHGAYDSSKARRDVPEFRCEIEFDEGAKQTLDDIRRRGAWRSCEGDTLYESMVQKALSVGVTPVEV